MIRAAAKAPPGLVPRFWAIAICLLVLGSAAHARPAPRVAHVSRARTVDWTRGLVIAKGASAADLRAPNPTVARIKAERLARRAARERLRSAVESLPAASGKNIGSAAEADPDIAARLARAVERSIDVDVSYSSDGSVVVTAGLPIEAVRAALSGPASPPEGDKELPTAVIVTAPRVLKQPVVGLELLSGSESYAGPTVYHRSARLAQGDPRLGARPIRAGGSSYSAGRVTVNLDAAELARARRAGALVVVVLGGKK